MFSPTTIITSVVLAALLMWFCKQKNPRLPPGPPRLPLIGNLHQAPTEAVWVTYQKWIDQYGPLVHLNLGGTSVILIGDHEIAKELLDKKANTYSSRPRMVSCTAGFHDAL